MSDSGILRLEIKLNDIYDADDWSMEIGRFIRETIEETIKAEVRKAVRTDPNFAEMIRAAKTYAVKAATGVA